MLKKTRIYFQILALTLLPAFVMRPVVVAVHNSALHSASQQQTQAFSTSSQQLSAFHSAFRNVEREAPDVTALIPRISKARVPSLLENHLNVVVASIVISPKSFLILRI